MDGGGLPPRPPEFPWAVVGGGGGGGGGGRDAGSWAAIRCGPFGRSGPGPAMVGGVDPPALMAAEGVRRRHGCTRVFTTRCTAAMVSRETSTGFTDTSCRPAVSSRSQLERGGFRLFHVKHGRSQPEGPSPGSRSEQRRPSRYPDPSGKAVRTQPFQLHLRHLIPRPRTHRPDNQAEPGQTRVRPPIPFSLGWLTHNQATADPQQRGRTLGNDSRWTETPGHHHIA